MACEDLRQRFHAPVQPAGPTGSDEGTIGAASLPKAAAPEEAVDLSADSTTLQRLRPGRCAIVGCIGLSFRHLFCETWYLCRPHFVRRCDSHTEIDPEEVMVRHQLEIIRRGRALAGDLASSGPAT